MKNFILISTFFSSLTLYSQSISVEAHEHDVNPNCCMTMLDDIGTEITVSNLTNSTVDIKVSREVISSTPGTINYFCWTACYGSQTSVSPQSKSFAPQQVDSISFQVHFDNLGLEPATASIRYCAFIESDPSDSSCTIVNYSVNQMTSLTENSISSSFSDFHPNPTSTISFLEYKLNYSDKAEIILTDILGNVIRYENFFGKSGILSFDLSDTKNGLYFANILVNGELKSIKRLVISK